MVGNKSAFLLPVDNESTPGDLGTYVEHLSVSFEWKILPLEAEGRGPLRLNLLYRKLIVMFVHTGNLTVYTSPDMCEASLQAKHLDVGASVTVVPKQLHYFLVGEEEVTVTMTFEPGALDFERAVLIMRGTQSDGTYQGYNDFIFMAVLGELTNSTGVGEAKELLDGLYASSKDEIKAKKAELLGKYASDEHLRALISP
ncbi:hypothetical protein LTS03_010768 [Exophiala xenobiotica]|nr:hypothetical protein LTR92_004938 [Exophiala xenobiotica]KAK5209160.1 hypothetical protein LTR41_005559 [Exophiala xenobiotica]KAK5248384.1 hypothetical protein LTS06_006582 [Exophiala xenobiotica]KAK5313921.1 hypothetical protein LTR93_010691 [Exophiala xenobiotica]KAK5352957.1 hypothetical protein LTR61_004085 [Exophiala xenobiotica]